MYSFYKHSSKIQLNNYRRFRIFIDYKYDLKIIINEIKKGSTAVAKTVALLLNLVITFQVIQSINSLKFLRLIISRLAHPFFPIKMLD